MMHVAKLSLSQKAREPEPEYFKLRINQIYVWKRKNGNVKERLAKIYDNYFQVSGGLTCVKKIKKHQ